MSAPARLTRRAFLRNGALATTGLVIAFHIPDSIATLAEADIGQSFVPNAWLWVNTRGRIGVVIARSEMGQGVTTSLAMLVADELEADWTRVGFAQAHPSDDVGNMGTGGSASIRSMWKPLRLAGAQAREMLIEAAARTWKVDRATCRAEKGAVLHTPTGRRLGYGSLVPAASSLPVPGDPPLKDPNEFDFIGRSMRRLDIAQKQDGTAVFGLDVRVPGMLVAAVARCPVFGGKVRSFDGSRAKSVTGVRDVIRISSGVAVIADSTWAARQGIEALEVEWDEGSLATLDSDAISRTYAALAAKPGAVVRREGDGAAALERAGGRIEAVYQTPYLAHATMEPMNCTAHVRRDSCEVWVGSQNATTVHEIAAGMTGLPKSKVTVNLTYLGGGFGRRHEQDVVIEAIELSKATGAPIKVVWSREDDMKHDWYRPATYHALRAGLDAAKRPIVWTHRMVGPAILERLAPAAVRNGVDPTSIDCAANLPYGIPHIEVDYVLHDPGIPAGFWRSVSASQNAFAVECFLDEVAAAAGRDPLDLRRELLQDHPRHRAVVELAARKAGWGAPPPTGRGRGLAVVESFGSFVAHAAEVSVAADGEVRVHRVVCAVDCGTVVNPDTVEAQMESGIVYGLSAALRGEIRIDRGRVAQGNFSDYPIVRMDDCPAIEVHLAPSGDPVGGIGEVGVPPIAPAVVNAVAAATGKRIRTLPIIKAEGSKAR